MKSSSGEIIGSTGQGVGSATARRILDRGVSETKLAGDMPELKPFIRPGGAALDKAFFEGRTVFVEGTPALACFAKPRVAGTHSELARTCSRAVR
jgi:hypothetical protein